MVLAISICAAMALRYCGASSSVISTITAPAPYAIAASQTSMPTDAVCSSSTGITCAGTPSAPSSSAPISALPCAPLWNSSARRAAAFRAVGRDQRAQARAGVGGARIGVGQRAGRAHRGAGAAAGAQVGVDLDAVARAGDRLGRADVDAGVAADQAIAAVRAQPLLVAEVFGLLEFADHLGQLLHGLRAFGHAGAGREIAGRRLVLRQQRRRRQVEHQVEACRRGRRRPPPT